MNMVISMEIDDAVFSFKTATKGDTLPSSTFTKPGSKVTSSPYKFLLDAMEVTDEDKTDGVIFSVTLTIDDTTAIGEYEIIFSYVAGDIVDENFEEIDMQIKNGTIIIDEVDSDGDGHEYGQIYTFTNEFGQTYSYIDYGYYPKTVVTDETLIAALDTISSVDALGYLTYQGQKYEKVVATPKFFSGYAVDDDELKYSRFLNSEKIEEGKVYYFLVEPIRWRILDNSDGKMLLMCEYLYDYGKWINSVNISVTANYSTSLIRNFLNNEFYNKAFYNDNGKYILETLVDNSLATTNTDKNSNYCSDTLDKVFALSYQDAINKEYGFSNSYLESASRKAIVTDYARAKGGVYECRVGYDGYLLTADWWTRSTTSSLGKSCVAHGSETGAVWSDSVSGISTGIYYRPCIVLDASIINDTAT